MFESRVRFRHLQTFLEVARQKSVVKAAGILNVSQPAVTKTIRELEEALGVAVLERDGRGIRITRSGEIFIQHAGMAITALRQGIDSVANEGAASGPLIRIGALPTVSVRVMPLAMSFFLRENTGATLKIVTGENAVLLEQLRVGDLDLVVGRLAAPEKMAGFFFEHLYSEQVVFVVRAGHPLLSSGQNVFKRLSDYPV
ncbi:MAG: LysR family transcriptional regulator, partial [Pseudaminobacter sp.]